MKIQELRKKNIEELNIELLRLLHRKLSLRIQIANNQLQQTHYLKQIRYDIAVVKTLLAKK